jgi:hypothetical protein
MAQGCAGSPAGPGQVEVLPSPGTSFCTSEAGAERGPLSLLADLDRYHRRPQVGRTSILRRMDAALRGRDQEGGGARCGKGRPGRNRPTLLHRLSPTLPYWM